MKVWRVYDAGWAAVAAWASGTYSVAALVRNSTATADNERVFACVVPGATGASSPFPTTPAQGSLVTDGAVSWVEITGQAAPNGDATNCPLWPGTGQSVNSGLVIKNGAATHYFVSTNASAGTTNATGEPTWNTTTGGSTADNTVTWICLGPISGTFLTAWGAPFAGVITASQWSSGSWPQSGNNDQVHVASVHNESSALAYNTFGGPVATPTRFLSVAQPTLTPSGVTPGAAITTTGGAQINFSRGSTGAGAAAASSWEGFTFKSSGNLNLANSGGLVQTVLNLKNCTLNPGAGAVLGLGNTNSTAYASQRQRLEGCAIALASTSSSIQMGVGHIEMANVTLTGTLPTTGLLTFASLSGGDLLIRDSDLSAGGSSPVAAVGTNSGADVLIVDSALGAGAALSTGSFPGQAGPRLMVRNCTGITDQSQDFRGSVAVSGAAYRGSATFSWNMQPANVAADFPLRTEDVVTLNALTGAGHTLTVYLTSSIALTNADFWIEVEYQGANAPRGTFDTSSRCATLVTPATLTTDTSTWTGGLANRYKVTAALTSLAAGIVTVRACLANGSANVYVDPNFAVT